MNLSTYAHLLRVLKYVIANEHTHFVEMFCKDDSVEAMEDAFADVSIQHAYKSAKLALWELGVVE